ncbi:Aldo/keto reductase, partial [Tothia fuscella]
PMLGFGTWMLNDGKNCTEAVAQAVQAGYRHFGGAIAYQNQVCVRNGLREGMKRTGLRRSDLWVTSKIWSTRHGDQVPIGMETNLEQLGLDYPDLTLMPFPIGTVHNFSEYDYVSTWKEMEKLVAPGNAAVKGKPRFIGIFKFKVTQLEDHRVAANHFDRFIKLKLTPYLQQNSFVALHKQHNITLTAYAPLADTNPAYRREGGMTGGRYSRPDRPPPILQNPVIVAIGKARDCTPAQVTLAWNMKRGIPVHPRAARVDHIKENFEAYKCALTEEDMQKIVALDIKFRMWNPCPEVLGSPCFVGQEGGSGD